jgi:hypothetical protein
MSAEQVHFAKDGFKSSYDATHVEFHTLSKSGSGSSGKLDNKTIRSEADLLSTSNINSLEQMFRRKSYNELPFISQFGMTTRETAIKKTMSMDGLSSLENNPLADAKVTMHAVLQREVFDRWNGYV